MRNNMMTMMLILMILSLSVRSFPCHHKNATPMDDVIHNEMIVVVMVVVELVLVEGTTEEEDTTAYSDEDVIHASSAPPSSLAFSEVPDAAVPVVVVVRAP
mmetsp:Transcript_50665/g.56587  ORF Transcript_50665/g.56587 Transcript_50665/m.56587 type:complete len:101 (-) Transcript_50665:11-313(-)